MRVRALRLSLTLLLAAGCASAPSSSTDLTADLGVADAARLIQGKQITSAHLTQLYLGRAESNLDLNAFITLDRAGALAAAQRADADLAAGRVRGPLHGVPLVVKDNIHVAGLPNTAGAPGGAAVVPPPNPPPPPEPRGAGAGRPGETDTP